MLARTETYLSDPVPPYEPEYFAPADLSWLDRIAREVRAARQSLQPKHPVQPIVTHGRLLQFPVSRETRQRETRLREMRQREYSRPREPDAPMSLLRLVRGGDKLEYSTIHDGRARLSYHVRGIEEACQILEDDPGAGSWDVEPSVRRLSELRRKFRRRERGEVERPD